MPKEYDSDTLPVLEVIEKNNKFGVRSNETGKILIPDIYDNVFRISKDYYVVIKNNKYGLFRISSDAAVLIADCVYDFINMSSKYFVVLTSRCAAVYVNLHTGNVIPSAYIESSEDYFYCRKDLDEFLINKYSGNVMYIDKISDDEPF